MDYQTLGPSTLFTLKTCDAAGTLDLDPPGRAAQRVPLGEAFAGRTLALLCQPALLIMLDPTDAAGRLCGIAIGQRVGWDVAAFCSPQPQLTTARGEMVPLADAPEALSSSSIRCLSESRPPQVGMRFLMNINHRDHFVPQLLQIATNPRLLHRLELWFEFPSGRFRRSVVVVQEPDTQRLVHETPFRDFPLRWPGIEGIANTSGAEAQMVETSAFSPEVVAAPVVVPTGPQTTRVPPEGLVESLRNISNDSDRWREIEANLDLLSPVRTYRIVMAFPDVVAENTLDWPLHHLMEVMADLPVPALQALFEVYPLDLCHALSERHAQREALLEGLRMHEVERLMSLDLRRQVDGAAAARHVLRLSSRATERQIKRVWRLLLGYLNADYGRKEERAIHRKKDEVAKQLQKARDLLLKSAR